MKEHVEKPCLEILVNVWRDKIVEMDTELGYVKMIPFDGTVKGELFNGVIEPCGVDTQVTNQNEVRHMSARYMLTGKDFGGNDCRIYVENNAYFTDGARPQPFRTVPTFRTDSPLLAPILHRNQFVGEGLRETEGLWIRYYMLKDKAE